MTSVCTVPGWEEPVRSRGWCASHYNRWHRYGDPSTQLRATLRPRGIATCQVDGCDLPAVGPGLCSQHYTRWRRKGDPTLATRGYTRIGRL